MQFGIIGTGAYLPQGVRENSWWPPSAVESWVGKLERLIGSGARGVSGPGVGETIAALERYVDDPFYGMEKRHVMAPDETSADMETAAAEAALKAAGVARDEVGLLLVQSMVPDYQTVNNATFVHQRLGLASTCHVVNVDSVCNSFISQLALATGHLGASRKHEVALLVQSSAVSRILHPDDPFSCWCGDGAAAVVLGPAAAGYGVLATSGRTYSEYAAGIATGVPKSGWWQGESRAYILEAETARRAVLVTADLSTEVCDDVLTEANVGAGEIDFFACHQNNARLPEVAARLNGLTQAKRIDTFTWAGSLSGANIPLQLDVAARENLLARGDLVMMFSMGSGLTTGAGLVRWGV